MIVVTAGLCADTFGTLFCPEMVCTQTWVYC